MVVGRVLLVVFSRYYQIRFQIIDLWLFRSSVRGRAISIVKRPTPHWVFLPALFYLCALLAILQQHLKLVDYLAMSNELERKKWTMKCVTGLWLTWIRSSNAFLRSCIILRSMDIDQYGIPIFFRIVAFYVVHTHIRGFFDKSCDSHIRALRILILSSLLWSAASQKQMNLTFNRIFATKLKKLRCFAKSVLLVFYRAWIYASLL